MSDSTTPAVSPFIITVVAAGPACKKVSVEIPEGVIADRLKVELDNYAKFAQLPGFRPGRAPRRLIEQKFGASAKGELVNKLISESYQAALTENKLDPISNPEMEGQIAFPEKGSLSYSFKIEVTPDIKLVAFETLELTKKAFPVTDADVQKELKAIAERHGSPTTPEGAAEVGDYVAGALKVLAGHGAKDDAAVLLEVPMTYALINGEAESFKGHIAGIVVENLGKELLGKKKGDVLRLDITGPKTHQTAAIQDQPVTLVFTVDALHRVVAPKIEELATKLGFAAVADLEAKIKEELVKRADAQQKADLQQQVVEALIAGADFELPEKVTATQGERILWRTRYEMMSRGVSEADAEQKIAELRNESSAEAKKQLKKFFVLDKASKELGIEVDEAEINGQIAMMAYQQGRRPDKMAEEMKKNMQIEQLYLQIRESKTLDKAIEKAKVVEA